jgi:hypothetical protein
VVTNNGYRCFPLDKTGRLVCDRPVIASVAAADRRVTDTWMDLVCDGAEEAEPLRRTVTEHWTPLGTPPPHWMRLKTELRELSARLEDADDAFDVRGNLDARRHARITEKLTLKVTQTEDAIATAEPTLDTTRLRDRDYVARRWAAHAPAGRRALLRLAWSEIHLAKATRPGGSFGEGRIAYYPCTTPNPDGSWPALLYGTPGW